MLRVLREYHILPRDYLALDIKSKAFIIACINLEDKWADEEAERIENEAKKG